MPRKTTDRHVSRRRAIATFAGGIGFLAAPAIVKAQAPLKVNFVQQRGLLYLPVDLMVSGGMLPLMMGAFQVQRCANAVGLSVTGTNPVCPVLPWKVSQSPDTAQALAEPVVVWPNR